PPGRGTGPPARVASPTAATISPLLRVSISHSAAPPTRNVVIGASGTWRRSRSAPKISRKRLARSLTARRTPPPPSGRVPARWGAGGGGGGGRGWGWWCWWGGGGGGWL